MNWKQSALAAALALALTGCDSGSKTTSQAPEASPEAPAAKPQLTGHARDLQVFAQSVDLLYRVIDSNDASFCNKEIDDGFCVKVAIDLTPTADFSSSDWAMYFSQVHPIHTVLNDQFTVEHINGDMHVLRPTETFKGLKAGETMTVELIGRNWYLNEYDIFPNFFITDAKGSADHAFTIESTRETLDPETGIVQLPFVQPFTDFDKQVKRTPDDNTPEATSTYIFNQNADLSSVDVASGIVPKPKSQILGKGSLDLASGLAVSLDGVERKDVKAALERLASFGIKESASGVPVNIKLVAGQAGKLASGSYNLVIAPNAINIHAVDAAGAFYALQSLASVVTLGSTQVPQMTVADEPGFDFRGMHVDVSRNFRSKEMIMDLIDQMAAYKLNKFHFHLADDEGWRLETKGLPELTEFGSKRCFDPTKSKCLEPMLGAGPENDVNPNNGYYTAQEYVEILRYADERHIQVIPSLDMPAHARAAVKAMQVRYNKYKAAGDMAKAEEFLLTDFGNTSVYSTVQFYNDNTINACMESSYAFIDKVMDEVKALHEQGGQPLTRYHIGADEAEHAWDESPVCKEKQIDDPGAYFIHRVAKILDEKGIVSGGWSDGIYHTDPAKMPNNVQANSWVHLAWSGGVTHELINRGWDVVLSTPDVLYFDFPYNSDPKEHGYYWASREITTRKIFEFMPLNLPVHTEFWKDRMGNNFAFDDTARVDEKTGKQLGPIKEGLQAVGIQGQLWSETTRTDDMAEYKIYPRLLGVAERAWNIPSWAVPYDHKGGKFNKDSGRFSAEARSQRDSDYNRFASLLGQKELAKMDVADIAYRVPTAGATVKEGTLHMNTAFPGLTLQYRVDGGAWKTYSAPVAVSGQVEARTLAGDGKRPSRTVSVK